MTEKEIKDNNCKNCTYYFGEIDQCMFGEDDVPDNLERKCEVMKNE